MDTTERDYDKLKRVLGEVGVEVYSEETHERDTDYAKSFTIGSDIDGDLVVFYFNSDGKYTGLTAP